MSKWSPTWLLQGIRLAMAAVSLSSRCLADDPTSPDPVSKPGAQETEQRELAERILQNTKQARDNLAEKVTDDQTHALQQQVVDDLAKLIEMLRSSPPSSSQNPSANSNSSASSSASDSNQKDRQKSQQSRAPKSTGSGAGENREQPEDSEERHGDTRAAKNRAERKRRLESDIWGHLPPALREQLLNTYGERMLPQYEEFVRKFYDALSEPTRTPQR